MAEQQIDSPSRQCAISGKAFAEGDAICSFLINAGKAFERVDVIAEHTSDFKTKRTLICRWNWTVKHRDNRAREDARSALEQTEAMFMALCDEQSGTDEEDAEERAALRQLLALALQRKRVLRPIPDEPDYVLHVASGKKLHCPATAELSEALLRKVAAQLVLI